MSAAFSAEELSGQTVPGPTTFLVPLRFGEYMLGCFSIAVVLVSTVSIRAVAQHVVVDGRNVCKSCKLILQREATLGDAEGDGMIPGHPDMLVRDSRGRIYVALPERPPLIFGPDGRYLGRVGRPGTGPGEFPQGSYYAFIGAGDTVYFHAGNRFLIFTKDGAFVRAVPFPNVDGNYTLLKDGRWLVQIDHIADGKVKRELGVAGPDLKAQTTVPLPEGKFLSSKTGLGRKTGVWTRLRTSNYTVELWGPDGKIIRSLERQAPWWVQRSDNENDPPGSGIAVVHDDADGRVWVFGTVPARDWKNRPTPPKRRSPNDPMYTWRFLYEMRSETMVEVIDPKGRLLVSQRMPGPVITMLDDSRVAVLRATEEGAYVIDILRLTITGA
jgi:hypothetical protein